MAKSLLDSIRQHSFAYALFIAVVYQLVCAVQGFDLSDEGWGMYFYQQIFKNPECVGAQMPYWVTGVIGGLWNKLFPDGGYFGMRVFGIILVSATFCLSYFLLKKSIRSGWLLIGLLAQVLIVAGDPKPYGYNSLTAFIVLLVIAAFGRGLTSGHRGWLFLGGCLLGVNVFVRIPNFAIFPIVLLIPAYMYWQDKKLRLFSSHLGIAVLGIVGGMLAVIVAMMYGGYWDYFMEAMSGVANSATDSTNSHQFGRLVVRYLKNYWGIFSVGGLMCLLGLFYVKMQVHLSSKLATWAINLFFCVLLCFLGLYFNKPLRHNDMYFTHAISYVGTLLILYELNKSSNVRMKFLALASLFMIVCMPLGSDQGINTMWTSAWLALPLGTAYLCSKFDESAVWKGRWGKWQVYKGTARTYLCILLVAYLFCGVYKNDNLAYYDPGSRLEKVHAIDNKYCRFIYTGAYRARLMNELLPVLDQYVKADDYLMVYNFMPGLNYMTDTRSYISNAWLWCLSGAEMKIHFNRAMSRQTPLPVVLRQNFKATNLWGEYDSRFCDVNREEVNVLSRKEQIEALNDFLNQHHYEVVWTNQYFDILLPKADK